MGHRFLEKIVFCLKLGIGIFFIILLLRLLAMAVGYRINIPLLDPLINQAIALIKSWR